MAEGGGACHRLSGIPRVPARVPRQPFALFVPRKGPRTHRAKHVYILRSGAIASGRRCIAYAAVKKTTNLTNAVCTVCCYAGPFAKARTGMKRSYTSRCTQVPLLLNTPTWTEAYETNTTPGRCTIHLAEEWTGGVDVCWASGLACQWIAWLGSLGPLGTGSRTRVPGTPSYGLDQILGLCTGRNSILPAILHT
eukprot:1928042-Rhodomonas_salina.1